MAKHIGIVAVSAEGAALCYRTICSEGPEMMGRHAHPEITMHTIPLSDYMKPIYEDDWMGVAELMLRSAEVLKRAGADFLICPDNTVHQAFDHMPGDLPLPFIHIADGVADEAKSRGMTRLAVLGTRYLMEGPVYRGHLDQRELGYETPPSEDRERINHIIFDELVSGWCRDESRFYVARVIERLRHDRGCDGVVLGCTEIPLLIGPNDSTLPTLDSTRLLARAALRRAVES